MTGSDRVLPATRVLSVVIIPFLVLAFVVLYFWPSADDTARLFAWRIVPGYTSMLLASVYLGGGYFFFRAARETRWHRVGGGFLSVGLFATMMGIATVIHWDRFVHTNLAFWLWVALYLTTPFLVFGVWLLNQRESSKALPGDLLIPPGAARAIGLIGIAATASSLFLFFFPGTAASFWPWPITELTGRVVGAIFGLGVVGLGAFVERRWSSARILVQVEGLMLALILVAVVRARGDFYTTKPLTWVFAVGFAGMAVGSATLYWRMEQRRAADLRSERRTRATGGR
ncbi:MAG: hypothetical protein ACOYD0_04985 [Candidatus Nanopelagicales bacterium]